MNKKNDKVSKKMCGMNDFVICNLEFYLLIEY